MTNAVLALFPVGYVFSPTDEELLTFYLYHKIVGDFEPPYSLPVIDLYSQEPYEIWQQLGGIDGQDLHFFTKLKKKKSRIIRKVGSNGGTWSGENRPTEIFSSADDNQLVGTLKRFHYENSEVKVSDDCSWIMHEYTVNPNCFVPKGTAHDSYVLCKIRKKILRKRKREEPPMQIQIYGQVSKRINQEDQAVQNEQICSDKDVEYYLNHNDFTCNEEDFSSLNGFQPQTCDDLENYLNHNDFTCILEDFPSLNDLQPQTCSMTQMKFLDQNSNNVALTNTGPTTQMKFFDQNLNNVERAHTNTWELKVCNNVEPTENVGFDNEWYWSGRR